MNRRQLLKGLGALPIAGTLGCAEESQRTTQNQQCRTLQITLEGAFALVLRRDREQFRITAFSPASPATAPKGSDCPPSLFPIEPHLFCFNGERQGPGRYRFALPQRGLNVSPKPVIDIGFRDFTADTERWRLGDNFVTLDLPCPRIITFNGKPEPVVFANPPSPRRIGHMPSNHILEYQIENADQVKMICEGLKVPCAPARDSTATTMKFSFGVGLPPNSDHGGKHAVRFFNYLLCGFFPDLVKAYELSYVGSGSDRPSSTGALQEDTQAAMVPAVLRNTMRSPNLLMVTSVVDCQAGGIIVSTDRPPIPAT
jgi:hypothetical protein